MGHSEADVTQGHDSEEIALCHDNGVIVENVVRTVVGRGARRSSAHSDLHPVRILKSASSRTLVASFAHSSNLRAWGFKSYGLRFRA